MAPHNSLGDANDAPEADPLAPVGSTLETALATGRLIPLPSVVRILGDLAVQIDSLHQRGFEYGVLSPAAVELTLDEHARLDDDADVPLPGPGYIAPERRHGVVSRENDIYALGIIAWELATGKRRETFLDGTSIAIVTELELGPARILRSGLGPLVNAAIERATNASVEVRYKSAGAFVADLAAALDPNAPHHELLRPARQGDTDDLYRAAIHHKASSTALGRVGGWVLGSVLAVGVVLAAAWFGGRSPSSLWGVANRGGANRGGFDWFGWKPNPTNAPGTPGGPVTTMGAVYVTVAGAQAEVLLDGSVAGRSPIVVPALPGSHTIQVRSAGRTFEPAAVTVRVTGSDTASAAFRVAP